MVDGAWPRMEDGKSRRSKLVLGFGAFPITTDLGRGRTGRGSSRVRVTLFPCGSASLTPR